MIFDRRDEVRTNEKTLFNEECVPMEGSPDHEPESEAEVVHPTAHIPRRKWCSARKERRSLGSSSLIDLVLQSHGHFNVLAPRDHRAPCQMGRNRSTWLGLSVSAQLVLTKGRLNCEAQLGSLRRDGVGLAYCSQSQKASSSLGSCPVNTFSPTNLLHEV